MDNDYSVHWVLHVRDLRTGVTREFAPPREHCPRSHVTAVAQRMMTRYMARILGQVRMFLMRTPRTPGIR